jgi:hypothetical protein
MVVQTLLWLLAGIMVVATAWILRRSALTKNALDYALNVFLFGMMASMFGGAVAYFAYPGPNSLVAAVGVSSAVMVASFVPVLGALVKQASNLSIAVAEERFLQGRFPRRLLLVGLALASELLMGLAFSLASGELPRGPLGGRALLAQLGGAASSYWFVFPMASEMLLTTYMMRRAVGKNVLLVVALQSAVMLFSPPALRSHSWVVVSAFLGSVSMTTLTGYFYMAGEQWGTPKGLELYETLIVPTYTFMMAAIFLVDPRRPITVCVSSEPRDGGVL